jgi:hypothetical protein
MTGTEVVTWPSVRDVARELNLHSAVVGDEF